MEMGVTHQNSFALFKKKKIYIGSSITNSFMTFPPNSSSSSKHCKILDLLIFQSYTIADTVRRSQPKILWNLELHYPEAHPFFQKRIWIFWFNLGKSELFLMETKRDLSYFSSKTSSICDGQWVGHGLPTKKWERIVFQPIVCFHLSFILKLRCFPANCFLSTLSSHPYIPFPSHKNKIKIKKFIIIFP